MNQCLIASIAEQRLSLFSAPPDQSLSVKSWSISSAKNGTGNQKNSNQTPLGWHLIRAKIGADLPIYSVFKARRPTGEICDLQTADPQRDWILSRILWLSGMQKGSNRLGMVDSMQRYIYIHATNEEPLLGRPVSHGCLRMSNAEVIELFAQVEAGCPLLISEMSIVGSLQKMANAITQIDSNYSEQKTMINQLFNQHNLNRFISKVEALC